jgi:Kef-type K+ transport system membrane component KefB
MTLETVSTLFWIAAAAVLAPVLADRTGRLRVPGVVVEIALGIIIGPHVLAIAHTDSVINGLSDLGLATLMFLAGYELDLTRVKGRPLRLAGAGWLMSVGIGLAAAFVLMSTGVVLDTLVVGLALTTTALGTLLPILRDADLLEGRFGARILAVGTAGEFCPIVALAVLLDHRDRLQTATLLVLFVAVAVATALLATRAHPPQLVALMRRHLHSSAQLPVRVSVLLLVGLVYLAFRLGLDVLLGAFAAGIAVRLFAVGEDSAIVRGKLEAMGFGFLVPIFFITSGMRFDVHALVDKPSALLRLPLFLALFLVARGMPAWTLYRHDLPKPQLWPLAFFSATGLPLIVVITTIGTSEGRMTAENAAALVGAGMLSVLIYPLLGVRLARRAPPGPQSDASEGADRVDGQPRRRSPHLAWRRKQP